VFVFAADEKSSASGSSSIVAEALSAIRTVASFGMHDRIMTLYRHSLVPQYHRAVKSHWIAATFFGFSQLATFASFAVCFYAGARLIDAGYETEALVTTTLLETLPY
jgi:ATP-binding cassette subfamily B (MDR/TAP) protein 1